MKSSSIPNNHQPKLAYSVLNICCLYSRLLSKQSSKRLNTSRQQTDQPPSQLSPSDSSYRATATTQIPVWFINYGKSAFHRPTCNQTVDVIPLSLPKQSHSVSLHLAFACLNLTRKPQPDQTHYSARLLSAAHFQAKEKKQMDGLQHIHRDNTRLEPLRHQQHAIGMTPNPIIMSP
jgi:hypothetical protein